MRILLVSEGQRSKARIPGMLALCRPCATEEDARLMPQARKFTPGARKLTPRARKLTSRARKPWAVAQSHQSVTYRRCEAAQRGQGDFLSPRLCHSTHHVRSNLPVFAELLRFHQLLRHSLASLRKENSAHINTGGSRSTVRPPRCFGNKKGSRTFFRSVVSTVALS